jgi:hypothetical protein
MAGRTVRSARKQGRKWGRPRIDGAKRARIAAALLYLRPLVIRRTELLGHVALTEAARNRQLVGGRITLRQTGTHPEGLRRE